MKRVKKYKSSSGSSLRLTKILKEELIIKDGVKRYVSSFVPHTVPIVDCSNFDLDTLVESGVDPKFVQMTCELNTLSKCDNIERSLSNIPYNNMVKTVD